MGGDKFRDEYSLAFDGTDDYVETSLNGNTFDGNFTISAWVKNEIEDIYHSIFSHYEDANNYMQLYIPKSSASQPSKTVFNGTIGGSSLYVTGATQIFATNNWVHVVFTQDDDANAQVMYVNAVSDATETRNWDMDYAGTTRIGRNSSSGSHIHQGNISEIAIYDTALSASQVKTLYNGREPYNHKEGIASGNLKAWYRMGDGRFDQFASEGIFGGDTGLMTDEVNPAKGVDLFDSGVGDYSSSTGAWAVDGTNTIENDSDAVKITYDNDSDGARLNLNDAADLTTNLTVGKTYELTFAAKINTGSVTAQLNDGSGTFKSFTINITDWMWKKHYFICQHATNCQLKQSGMGAGEIIWIKNVRLKEAGSNSGVMTNMAEGDIVGDTP